MMEILFWIYIGLSLVISAGLYLTLWSTQYVQNVIFPMIHMLTYLQEFSLFIK